MNNDIKDKLINDAKNDMPDLWDKIEDKLEDKKKSNKRKVLPMVAALAFVIVTGTVGSRIWFSTNNEVGDLVETPKEIVMLPDLNQENTPYLEFDLDVVDKSNEFYDKINNGGMGEASYAMDKRFIEYDKEADNVIYGKVVEVNSYVDFGIMIVSDIKIQVIEDYKGNKEKGDTIILGNKGGELTYQEFLNQSYDNRIQKLGLDKIEDKNQILVEATDDGIPQYRIGEYVLVYAEQLKGDDKANSYSQDKNGVKRPVSYDYFALKKLYVNPNTEEVFQYIYKDTKLVKEKVDTLANISNFYR